VTILNGLVLVLMAMSFAHTNATSVDNVPKIGELIPFADRVVAVLMSYCL
jgi:hypothetical protein